MVQLQLGGVNTAWTALHVPAVFTGPANLPVGLQLVGRYRQDAALLAAAKAVCLSLGVETAGDTGATVGPTPSGVLSH